MRGSAAWERRLAMRVTATKSRSPFICATRESEYREQEALHEGAVARQHAETFYALADPVSGSQCIPSELITLDQLRELPLQPDKKCVVTRQVFIYIIAANQRYVVISPRASFHLVFYWPGESV